jgi:hypothetical protein
MQGLANCGRYMNMLFIFALLMIAILCDVNNVAQEIKLVERFDVDGDKVLRGAERQGALEALESERPSNHLRRGPGFAGEPREMGKKLAPADVKSYPDASLYEPTILRTIFLQFDTEEWEKELAAFKYTDVQLPAQVTVDGKSFVDVGVHFRAATGPIMMGMDSRKRSLNLSFDFVNKDQHLGGYRELELLNASDDAAALKTNAAAKASLVRVVINGENWGIYLNTEIPSEAGGV